MPQGGPKGAADALYRLGCRHYRKGPVFIEGNSFPSHAVPQFAAHYPDGIGIMREFRQFIDI